MSRDVDYEKKCVNGRVSLRDIRQILDVFCDENGLSINDPKAIAAARFLVSRSEDDLCEDDVQAVLRLHFADSGRSTQPYANTDRQRATDGKRYRIA